MVKKKHGKTRSISTHRSNNNKTKPDILSDNQPERERERDRKRLTSY